MPRPAFTLIELLIVVTIIVVLLAMLTPALDKAIYQAEWVTCGAQEDVVAGMELGQGSLAAPQFHGQFRRRDRF